MFDDEMKYYYYFEGVSRDVCLLRDSCRVFNIAGNPLKFITVDNAAASSSSPARIMKLLKFRQELNITSFVVTSFVVYQQLKVTAA